jgi:hypothetical protein
MSISPVERLYPFNINITAYPPSIYSTSNLFKDLIKSRKSSLKVFTKKLSKNDLPGFIVVRKVAGENPANKSGTTADRRG